MEPVEQIAQALTYLAGRLDCAPDDVRVVRFLVDREVIAPGERLADWMDAVDDGDSDGQA